MLVGLGVCLFALPVGIIITVVSAVLLFITWKNNQHKEYRLLLKLNNGDVYNLTYGDLDDIIEVVESIRLIVEEKFDGNLLINNSNTININDNSVGKVCGNIFKGDTDDMQQFTNSKNPMDSQLHTSNITEEERQKIGQYFTKRLDVFEKNSNAYKNCSTLIKYIHNKQDEETHKYIRQLAREKAFQEILGSDREVFEILKKI